MNDENYREPYLTKDIYESAYLYACGKKLNSVNWKSTICYFAFEPHNEAKKLTEHYWSNEARINPRQYADAIRNCQGPHFSDTVSMIV